MGFFKGLKKLGAVFFFIADVFFFIADAPDHIRAYMAAHFCGYAKNTLSSCHDHSVDTEMPSKNVVDRLMKYAGYRKLGARIGHTSASAMPFKSLWEDPTFANLFRTLPTLLHCSLLVLFGLLEMMTVCFRWILFILIVGGFFVLGFVLGLVLLVMALAGLMEGAGAKVCFG